ncbi:MAG: DUF4837 family protein [bacterium]|nr:DUF4837 family protein [bacterium]
MNPTRHAAALLGAAALCLVLTLGGCGGGGNAMVSAVGSYGDVALVVSDPQYDPLLERARGLLSPTESFVLKSEPTYRFRTCTDKNWRDARNYRNVLMAVRWGDGGPVQGAAKHLLPKKALERALAGRGEVFTVRNPWLHNQIAFIAVAKDADALVTLLNRRAPALRDTLAADINRRIAADHRAQGLLADPPARQHRRFGFSVELPAAYRENQCEPDGFPGVEWLRTDGSTRGLTVSWEAAPAPAARLADHDALAAMRSRLGAALHQETIDPASFVWSQETVAGLPAVKLAGSWVDAQTQVGGPFRCYFLAEPAGGRIFCFDLLVYAPQLEKMDDFRRLRAILETVSFREPA